MQEQLPKVSLERCGHPDAREAVRAQQLQQMTGVSRVRLLLAHHRRANRCGIAHPEFVPAAIQQTLEPSRRAGGLHSYAGPARQRGVEICGFLPVVGQPPLHDFCGFRVEHGNLLIPRMKITAYHPHRSAPFFRTLVVKRNQVYSVARSRRLHGIRQDDKQAHGRKRQLAQARQKWKTTPAEMRAWFCKLEGKCEPR